MSAMKIDIDNIAAQIGAIDTRSAAAELAQIDKELERIAKASKDVDRQLITANQQHTNRRDGPDVDRAAGAVIDGVDVLEAVETLDGIEHRIATLRAAKRGLARRESDQRSARESVTLGLKVKLRDVLAPVTAAIEAEVAESLGRLTMLGRVSAELEAITGILSPLAVVGENLEALGHRLGIAPIAQPLNNNLVAAIQATFPVLAIVGLRNRAQVFFESGAVR